MKNIFLLSFLLILFSWHPAYADMDADEEREAIDSQYMALVESAKYMEPDFDFIRVRKMYVHTSFFKPTTTNFRVDFRPFFEDLGRANPRFLKKMNKYARYHFPFVGVHIRAMAAYKKFRMKNKIKYHAWAAHGIEQAMYAFGDALSKETAMPVLNISEEDYVARKIGEATGKRVMEEDGKIYEILTVNVKDTEESIEMWFDATLIYEYARIQRTVEEAQ